MNKTKNKQKALSQVGWLCQRQCQSFNRLNAFYWPKLPQTQSSIGPKIPVETLLLPKRGFLKRGSEAGSQSALKPALKRPLKMLSMSVSALA
jgi:hypothetical protein